jgi:hypothetical protein
VFSLNNNVTIKKNITIAFELYFFSPDSSENPFLFFFKKEKIETNSWI